MDPTVRALCRQPYHGHPKGCPNWNTRPTCPPDAKMLTELLDVSSPMYCIYSAFDLASHVARMRARHPDWSDRKLACCLYWQGTSRKMLREIVRRFLQEHPRCEIVYCPEACGVDVTATMASIGVHLEWPPVAVAYHVALAGAPLG